MYWSSVKVKCLKPYVLPSNRLPVPCGKCLGCRINRSRGWVFRMLAEATNYKPADISFLTLTYDDEHLPQGLKKVDVQLFLKRLRKFYEPRTIRYFFCGEYGETTKRPHYHAIIYGVGQFELNLTISALWKLGFSVVGDANIEAIQYVAGYVTKKITYKEQNKDLPPEFILTSRRPGLGAGIADYLVQNARQWGDCPPYIMMGNKKMSVPFFVREKVRKLSFDDSYIKEKKAQIVEDLRLDFILNWSFEPGLKNYYDYREREMKIKNKGTLHE